MSHKTMESLAGKRIFIVEDDPMNIAVNSAALVRTGATVIQDPWNTNTIQRLIKSLPIDIILLDLMLKFGVTGYAIFDEIKTTPQLAPIPVIAVSAADPVIEIPKTQAKGFSGFIGKPIKPRVFPQQILACIEGEQIWFSQDNNYGDF